MGRRANILKEVFLLRDRDKARKEAELDECPYCYQEGASPKIGAIAVGIKAYLALPDTIDMVPFHCFIVPMNHVTTSLELDDDVWDEIRVSTRIDVEF